MARSRFFSVALVLAAGAAGCAHCDTCDDMPVPCSGPGCNAALRVAPPPMESVAGPTTYGPGSLPIAPSSPSAANSTSATMTPPPLPDVPAAPPETPPPAPSPEKP